MGRSGQATHGALLGRPRTARLARFGLPAFLGYTRLRNRRLARRVGESIADYQANGVSIVALVGVGASPSCGVASTVDVAAALDSVVGCPFARLDRQVVNDAIAGATRSGPGIFMDELGRALGRRGLSAPLREHDLRSERPWQSPIAGCPSGDARCRSSGHATCHCHGSGGSPGGGPPV